METETEAALVDAVLAVPEDDAPRLVYADYLSARNDPRGELIIVQCAVKRLEAQGLTCTPEFRAAERRRRELEPAFAKMNGLTVSFDRGFLSYVRLRDIVELRERVDMLARHPIRQLSLEALRLEQLRELAAMPFARYLERITLRAHGHGYIELDAQTAFALVASTVESGLAWEAGAGVPHPVLHDAFESGYFTPATNRVLRDLSEENLPRLRELTFSDPLDEPDDDYTIPFRMSGSAFATFASTPTFAALESFSASLRTLEAPQVVLVLNSAHALKKFTYYGGISEESAVSAVAAALAASPSLPHLTDLTLPCGESAIHALENAPNLESFSTTLHGSDRAVAAFAGSSLPKRFRRLSLMGGARRPRAKAIIEAPYERLLDLGLHQFEIDTDPSKAPHLETLVRVSFGLCELPPELAVAIRERWPNAQIY